MLLFRHSYLALSYYLFLSYIYSVVLVAAVCCQCHVKQYVVRTLLCSVLSYIVVSCVVSSSVTAMFVINDEFQPSLSSQPRLVTDK